VVGIKVGDETLRAGVVVAATAPTPSWPRQPGSVPAIPHDVALGVKAVVTLPCAAIEERFGLIGNEGAACSFDGEVTVGLMGGGFVYTNLDSLSVGLVVRLDDLIERGIKASQLLTDVLDYPLVQPLL